MTKIEALEKTIFNLENDVYVYGWYDSNSCNCGILARTLLHGKDPWDAGYFETPQTGEGGTFSRRAHCIATGIPLTEVFQALKDAGFSYKEIQSLEKCGDKDILAKMNLKPLINDKDLPCHPSLGYSDKNEVIKYLKAWVGILKEEQPNPQPIQQYTDVTKSLALMPIEETSDVVGIKEIVK